MIDDLNRFLQQNVNISSSMAEAFKEMTRILSGKKPVVANA